MVARGGCAVMRSNLLVVAIVAGGLLAGFLVRWWR